MKKYIIVEAPTRKALEKSVQQYIKDGWKVKGGVQIVLNKENVLNPKTFYQTVVK